MSASVLVGRPVIRMNWLLHNRLLGCLVGCSLAAWALPASPAPSGVDGAGREAAGRVAATGVLRGVVLLEGAQLPPPTRIENTTDPSVCGRVHETGDLLVSAPTRGIRNVIVSLVASGANAAQGTPRQPVSGQPPARAGGGAGSSPAGTGAPPSELILDNRDCEFVPRVAVVTVGDTIRVVSHDHTLHTTHLYGAVERNFALPNAGARATVRVDQPGMITVLCDVHGWMRAFVRVDPHPHHAVTDAAGRFAIEGIPAGTYELQLWHERLGTRSRSIRIVGGTTASLDIHWPLK